MNTALGLISFCLALVALVMAVVWLVLSLIRKDQRTKYSKRTGFAILAMFVLFGGGGYFADADMAETATEAGYASVKEMRAAEAAGFTDSQSYFANKAEQEAEAARQAEAAKQEAERAQAEAERVQAEADRVAREKAEADVAACRQSASCYSEKFLVSAETYCPEEIERLAQWDHEWTDGMLEMKFSRSQWKDKEAGVIDYYGDKLKMQNGFGAWQNVVYVCTFSTTSEKVLGVAAEPGRF